MLDDRLKNLIAINAQRFNLPDWLITSIILVESSGNTWAARFEPAFLETYVGEKVPTYGASTPTERISRATSWGLMQIMGQVARELGFTGPFLSELCDPEVGLLYGCMQLARLWARYFHTEGWAGVIAAYNAGSPRRNSFGHYVNQSYIDKVMKLQTAG